MSHRRGNGTSLLHFQPLIARHGESVTGKSEEIFRNRSSVTMNVLDVPNAVAELTVGTSLEARNPSKQEKKDHDEDHHN